MKSHPIGERFSATFRLTHSERQHALDLVLADACHGDRFALAIVAEAFGPALLDAARAALDPARSGSAPDLVQELWLQLAEGALRFTPGHDGADTWLRAAVRALASAHDAACVARRAAEEEASARATEPSPA